MEVGHCFLDGSADAVEFCGHESYLNVLAASTYVLQEGDQPTRSGSITLFDVDAESGRFDLIQKVETAGIFDIKWSPGLLPLLAQADADGCVKLYSLPCSGSDTSELDSKYLFSNFTLYSSSGSGVVCLSTSGALKLSFSSS